MSETLGFFVPMAVSFQTAVDRTVEALKVEGFGVLTRIDVRETLKEKLGKDFRPYVILGACNPPLAHRALSTNPLVGLLLPCNVTVEERQDGVWVSIVNPDVMMSVGGLQDDAGVCGVAAEARARLERVAEALRL